MKKSQHDNFPHEKHPKQKISNNQHVPYETNYHTEQSTINLNSDLGINSRVVESQETKLPHNYNPMLCKQNEYDQSFEMPVSSSNKHFDQLVSWDN